MDCSLNISIPRQRLLSFHKNMCRHDGYSEQTYYTLGRTFLHVLSASVAISNWRFCNRHGQYLGANPLLLQDKGNLKTSRPEFFLS